MESVRLSCVQESSCHIRTSRTTGRTVPWGYEGTRCSDFFLQTRYMKMRHHQKQSNQNPTFHTVENDQSIASHRENRTVSRQLRFPTRSMPRVTAACVISSDIFDADTSIGT